MGDAYDEERVTCSFRIICSVVWSPVLPKFAHVHKAAYVHENTGLVDTKMKMCFTSCIEMTTLVQPMMKILSKWYFHMSGGKNHMSLDDESKRMVLKEGLALHHLGMWKKS